MLKHMKSGDQGYAAYKSISIMLSIGVSAVMELTMMREVLYRGGKQGQEVTMKSLQGLT